MAEAILDALGPVLTRWTMGGSALAAAPAPWRAALAEEVIEAELRLLALSGQFLGALVLCEPAGELRALADLPRLDKPPLPEALRPLARRLLALLREPARRRPLLDLIDTRGWTLHPGDWLPGAQEDVPEAYARWQDWATGHAAADDRQELTAQGWDSMPPAARRAAFATLRRQDPAQARALLAQKIGHEGAENRLRLLDLLANGLADEDRPLLEGLAGDRAARVRALAASLLARLGDAGESEAGEDAGELAGFFTIRTKGLLRRGRLIAAQEIKTPAQRQRRSALMESLPLASLARGLGLSPHEMPALWPWGKHHALDRELAAMAARSAPDAVVVAMLACMGEAGSLTPFALQPLLPRLTPPRRQAAAMQLLQAPDGTFAMAQDIVGGGGAIEAAIRSHAGARMLERIRLGEEKAHDLAAELLALGLIATREGARQAMEQIGAAGITAGDPRLDMLRLNAALDHEGHL